MSSVAEKLQKKAKRPVGTRQVRLRLVYLDFWSMVKLSFLIALAGSIVIVVATRWCGSSSTRRACSRRSTPCCGT